MPIAISTQAARHAIAVVTAIRGASTPAELWEVAEFVMSELPYTNALALIGLASVVGAAVTEAELRQEALRLANRDVPMSQLFPKEGV